MARPISIALAISMGMSIMFYLNEMNAPLKQYFKELTAVCSTDLYQPNPARHPFFAFHIPGLDHFNCITTPFYKQALHSPDGLFLMRQVLSVFLSILGLLAVESLRPTSSGFVAYYPLVAGLSQLIGASVIFPWAWLSSYWWVNQTKIYTGPLPFNSKTNPHASHREPYPTRVLAATISLLLLVSIFTAVCLPSQDDTTINFIIAVFNPIIPVLAMLCFLVPARHSTDGLGHTRAVWLHCIMAVVCYAFHVWSVYPILFKHGFPSWGALIPVMTGSSTGTPPSHFLFVDLAALFVQCMWFVALEPIEGAVLPYLALSVLMGPGTALSLFLVRRENFLSIRKKKQY